MDTQEIEAKYHVRDLSRVADWLKQAGAQCVQPRTFERNLRFDNATGDLHRQGCVLRLRQDEITHLAYKGASQKSGGVLSRTELEFAVSNFDTARAFLEALGYHIVAIYEKYRCTYRLGNFQIMLDELPYGDFVEIEGPNPASIQRLTRDIGLNPAKPTAIGYLALFASLCPAFDLDPSQLTFAALQGTRITPQELGVEAADSA